MLKRWKCKIGSFSLYKIKVELHVVGTSSTSALSAELVCVRSKYVPRASLCFTVH